MYKGNSRFPFFKLSEYQVPFPMLFDDTLTQLQKMNKISYNMNHFTEVVLPELEKELNEMVNELNLSAEEMKKVEQDINNLKDYINSSLLKEDIMGQMMEWLNDGTLTDLLNQGLTKNIIPYRNQFGGQLKKLKESLTNVLEQYVEIVFIGDSITWGLTLPDNGITTPRDGTLSDARDNYISNSFVNLFKKYVGKNYMGKEPSLSNWDYSPSGQAIATWIKNLILFPNTPEFSLTMNNISTSMRIQENNASVSKRQYILGLGDVDSHHELKFNFTGDTFTLAFSTINEYNCDYELFVDGVSKGTFTTGSDSGNAVGNGNQRVHNFEFVRNKEIKIVTKWHKEGATNYLYLEGIIVPKTVKIINQGIIGTDTYRYKVYNMPGNQFGDGSAVGSKTSYVFSQFGANDRLKQTTFPEGVNTFKNNYNVMLDLIPSTAEVILMVSNPVEDESTSKFSFNMSDVRGVVYEIAKERNYDMIDNFLLFNDLNTTSFTADGLHPNALGHKMIFQNIFNSIEV